MMQRSRKDRMGALRRILTVEALEDRTLLNGVVRAVLEPTGLLKITGDAGNNQFTIAPSPLEGMIRISGNPGTFTAINGVRYTDFALADVTDIHMTMLDGLDKATLSNFSIAGDLTILYRNPDDVFLTPAFTARNINLVFAGDPLPPDPGGGGGGEGGGGSGVLGSGNNGGLLPPVGGGGGGLLPP